MRDGETGPWVLFQSFFCNSESKLSDVGQRTYTKQTWGTRRGRVGQTSVFSDGFEKDAAFFFQLFFNWDADLYQAGETAFMYDYC